jgi:hypothetical protein
LPVTDLAALQSVKLFVEQSSRADGDGVVVELSPNVIGNALDAADYLPSY